MLCLRPVHLTGREYSINMNVNMDSTQRPLFLIVVSYTIRNTNCQLGQQQLQPMNKVSQAISF